MLLPPWKGAYLVLSEDVLWPGVTWCCSTSCSVESLFTTPPLIHHKLALMKRISNEGYYFLAVWWNSNKLVTPSVPEGQGNHPRVQELHEGWRTTSLCPPASSQLSWIWLSCSNQSPWPVKKIPFPIPFFLGFTSLMWRKSLASKEMAVLGTGTSSSRAPQ